MKEILVGLGCIIGGIWTVVGFIALLGTTAGLAFTWVTWIAIAPILAIAIACLLAISYTLGEKILD